jgi:hypothetical protein
MSGDRLQGLIETLGMRYKVDPASPPSSDAGPGLYDTVVAAVLGAHTTDGSYGYGRAGTSMWGSSPDVPPEHD